MGHYACDMRPEWFDDEKPPKPEPAFRMGDIVASTDPQYPLRSGGQLYGAAVVISERPLVLVSEHADMRWESTVRPDKLRVIGRASPHLLAKCLGRL